MQKNIPLMKRLLDTVMDLGRDKLVGEIWPHYIRALDLHNALEIRLKTIEERMSAVPALRQGTAS